ncbi:nitrogenase iron-molybdenum cofactor biosynthesis protein NifE [Clostridium felsineum]|uniref:nitrogenase iron-molybdenum cofactor biosynthesis protein NifE n=1 Tax=Clostridium felsineum TaxID=36839 RepID=UPI00098CABC9|nr:nitrogenase iron-molybdenum cofactor biosynthesis protein NifE [Clostridium felsineum]URZ18253.1 Nitrogenase molybdenum-iron protein alpha chain [Clostridium felsineum DSM 794]
MENKEKYYYKDQVGINGKLKNSLNLQEIIEDRKGFVCYNSGGSSGTLRCDENSVSGAVSQRACVYCGARVVLNPITDAFHLIHGPIGCASYTWDLRGSLSSSSELFRNSFSTDLSETDVIFGGEKKLRAALDEIYDKFQPKVVFIYATCIVGVIGDDVDAVCCDAEKKYPNMRVIPVKSPGFSGNKATGYRAACDAILKLIGNKKSDKKVKGLNYLGDFNLAGEAWVIQSYLKEIGIPVIAKITGDSKCEELLKAPEASLNIVQCAGSMEYLAKKMQELYGIPYIRISFLGIEDTENSLLQIAHILGDEVVLEKAERFIEKEKRKVEDKINLYKKRLKGKKAAIYVGGGYKAISLIKQFKSLGIETVMVGTQTGKPRDYEIIKQITRPGTVILDDANPSELEKFMLEKGADILVGGVKERPLAYKLGVAFCDHNHERKQILSGFVGALNFAQEIDLTANSPVWNYV